MNKKIRIMSEEKISSALLKFGIPAIIGFLITAIYNFVDALFLGQLGTNVMGAAAVVFPITFLMIGIGLLLGSGAASVISRLLGRKQISIASQAAAIATYGSVVLGLLIIALLLAYLDEVMIFLGATLNILPYALDYGSIFISGSIFSIVNIVLNNIARAEGAAKTSMSILVVGAMLNIVLDPLLIYTFEMGIRGAAIATFVAQGMSTLLLIKYFIGKNSVLSLSIRNFTLSSEIIIEMVKIGIPYCIAQLLASISMGLINSAAAPYGESAVAAVGIATRIFAIGIFAMIGFSKGFQPIAGYNYGAEKFDRLQESIKISTRWTTYCCIFLAVIQVVFANQIVSFFTDEKEVIEIGARTLIIYSLVFPLFGYQVIYMTLFLALGKVKQGFILSLGRQGIFLLPAIFVLPKILGLNGVIYSQPVADFLTVMLTVYFHAKWKVPVTVPVE